MTSAQTMLNDGYRRAPGALGLALACAVGATLWLGGCAGKKDTLVAPAVTGSPYDASGGEVLWGVVPLRNESGTTLADTLLISDAVVAAVEEVRGVRALPVNRTIAAMRALGMSELDSPAEVRRLAEAMGVDGIIVGTITAYDPYHPPTLGLALALYARPGRMEPVGTGGLDVSKLRYQPTEYRAFPNSTFADAPASVVSDHLDGKNHEVLMDVQRYAAGRHDRGSALGWRRFLVSMDLYTEFAAWRMVGRLLEHEWIRLAQPSRGEQASDR